MSAGLPFLIQNVLIAGCAIFAYRQGGRAERLGAVWFGVNMIVGVTLGLSGWASPVVQLVEDGIFALGLLPLTMIYVSYWMGLLTLIAAALFSLEAAYLLNDRPVDNLYIWVNNLLWLAAPLVLLSCGITNWRHNRKAALAAQAPAPVEA